MLNKDNYVPWSSRIIRYARSRPNGKMIVDSIKNGPYVRRMMATLGEPNLHVTVPESFHEQTDQELTENDIKRMDADDQAIQTILLGLLEDVYPAAKLFNEWEKFTSTDGESIESYYHRFMQLMNDLKRNKHFPENIAANLKFLNNLQPEWKRHVTIVRQTKNLHEANFTQIYDFLKMNQDEVNELRAERLVKTHDHLALMAHSHNSYNFPATLNDQTSSSTHSQQSFPISNKYNPHPSLNQNFMQPPMTSLEDVNDPIEAMNAALILFAKVFQLTAPTNNNQMTLSNPHNRQIAQPGMNMIQDRQIQNVGGNDGNQFGQHAGQVSQNQQGYNAWQNGGIQVAQNAVQNAAVQSGGNQEGVVVVPGIANQNGTGNVVAAMAEGTINGNQARCYNCRGLGHISMNCTARLKRRDAAYLQTQLLIAQKEEGGIQLQAEEFDFMAAVGDLDEIEEVNANCILMANLQHVSTSGTQLDKAHIYDTDGSAKVQLNDNCYDNEIFNMFTQEEQYTDLLEPIPEPQIVPRNENHVNSVAPSMVQSRGIVETSSAPNEETRAHQEIVYRNLIDQVAQEDMFLDKEIDLEAKIKDLENILLKRDQTVQTMHMLNPNPNSFYHPDQKIALGYPNPSYLKKAQQKQQSLYNGNLMLEEHIPPDVYDSEETLELAQETKFVRDFKTLAKKAHESLDKKKSLELEIKRLLKASVSHDIVSIVQNGFVDVLSDLQTELNRTKEKLELCIIKKEKEYTVLWNNWYTKYEECKYDKISYDKAYNDMQQKVKRLQAQLRDLKGKSSDTLSASNTFNTLNQKLQSKIVELEFQVVNYEREISHLKTNYKNLFYSITSNRAHAKLHNLIYENAKLRARLFENTSEFMKMHTARTKRPQPKGNTRNARSPLGGTLVSLEIWMVLTCSNRFINLYTINLYNMASASPICLMAGATPTKSWFWHQRLSHLNFDTINDLAKNDLVSGLPKFKYAKEHICPSCEQGKSKRASHPPKHVSNLKQRLHLLHMDLCGPMRVASINGRRYVLMIVDDYSRYTWVHFLKTNDETPEVIKIFLKKIYVRLQAPVIIVRTDNGTEFKNHALKEYFNSVGITHETSAAKTPQQNGVVECRNRTLVEAARTIKPYISYLHVFGALCYPKNDREDIGKLGGDVSFFIRYSANFVAYRVYNRRTKKIMKMMNVTFDELLAMTFEQNSSKPGLQMHNEFLGGRPSEAPRTILAAPVLQNLQAPTASMSIQDSAPTQTNSSNTSVSSHNVDAKSQQHAHQQRNLTLSPTASAANNVLIMKPKSVKEALTDPAWIESIQEELRQFIRLDVCELVPSPDGIKPLL
nr:hypothetical protein [Tanacetum cinerariifolium]